MRRLKKFVFGANNLEIAKMSSRKKEDCDKSINAELLPSDRGGGGEMLSKSHKHGSKTLEVAATDEIRVLESDVKDIIEMMKADLDESIKQEKEEENRGGRTETKSGGSNNEHNFELSSLSNQSKPEQDEDSSSSSASPSKEPVENEEQKNEPGAAGGHEEELQTSRTKTTTDLHEGVDTNNLSDSNSPYECIKTINELRLRNLAPDDEDADSGPNSAHSLVKKYSQQVEAKRVDQRDWFDDHTSAEIAEFIDKAREFGANALDLSRRNLSLIPRELSQLAELQVGTT